MSVDLKDTLNLPQTDFPMRAQLVEREPLHIEHWKSIKLYKKIQEKNQAKVPFILHDGPPFTNGDVHIGTALNKIIKDIIVKYKSMRGFRAPYHPGWDCHGLPIEHKVSKELEKKKLKLNPAEIRKACMDFSSSFIEKQTRQFVRLGVLADWDQQYKTMDPAYEATILRTFARFVEQGLVYRSKKPVYWSIPCKTALAEAEIEYKDHESYSVWVTFELPQEEALKVGIKQKAHFLVWTTTPWTLPANQAIALHPQISYVELEHEGTLYILAKDLVESVTRECKLTGAVIGHEHMGKDFEGLVAKHPFINRGSPLVCADYVTTDSGSGCVHTAPGHGLDDYFTGIKYGLEVYCPVNDNGRFVDDGQMPSDLVGLSVLKKGDKHEANEAILKKLKTQGALVHFSFYTHQYPYCWRSKTPVIFRAMDQWFVSLDKDDLRQKALLAISRTDWVPVWGENRIKGAVESRPDWCISRQRSWGVPLPAFYDEEGNALLDARVIQKIADKVEHSGTQIWFEQSASELLQGVELPEAFRGKQLKVGTDTLDVWIDSGCSHRAVLQQNPSLHWPADLYFEGSDQHRGWFQSSLWTGVIADQAAPYKKVITHGFVVDEHKRKISKSDGKPQTADSYIEKYGADIIRLWIASEDFRNDVPLSENIIKQVVQAYRTIRNTLRFQVGNLYDFNFEKDAIPVQAMTYIDQWALHETNELIRSVTAFFDNYEFHRGYQQISRFCSVVLSAVYHDILKDRLYTYGPDWPERRSSQTAIYYILHVLMRLGAPILVFTMDEVFSYASTKTKENVSVHLQDWPEANPDWDNKVIHAEFEALLKIRQKVNESLEQARQNKLLGQSLDAKVVIGVPLGTENACLLEKYRDKLEEFFIVSQVVLETSPEFSFEIKKAEGVRCPRSWRWVPSLVEVEGLGKVSPRCQKALSSKFSQQPLTL